MYAKFFTTALTNFHETFHIVVLIAFIFDFDVFQGK